MAKLKIYVEQKNVEEIVKNGKLVGWIEKKNGLQRELLANDKNYEVIIENGKL